MSGLNEHSRRWEHRPQPPRAVTTTHWSAIDDFKRTHPGPVSESCPLCHPEESTDEA